MAHPMSQQWLDWRTVDSAPKDGTRVLIWPGCWPASWSDEVRHQEDRFPGWLIVDCEDPWYTIYSLPQEVTHWAPQPEGPQS